MTLELLRIEHAFPAFTLVIIANWENNNLQHP